MADVETSDAAGKINVAIAVDILKYGALCFRHVDRCGLRKAARHGVARRSPSAFDLGPGI